MTTQHSNPFVLPGLGQAGEPGQNPLIASMEMMRQAWQTLASSGALSQPALTPPLTVEDLDKRISDLRAVENWLRLNMSMLTSSIQALEVQRATVATLKAFIDTPGLNESLHNPSPLEVALGLKPAGQAKIKEAPAAAAEQGEAPGSIPLSDAAQGWWNMLQKQFDTLAAATAATMEAAASPPGADAEKASSAQAKAQSGKPAARKTRAAVKSADDEGAAQAKPARGTVRRRATTSARKTRSTNKGE